VLGTHALTSGPFGETYTCRPRAGEDLEAALNHCHRLLPEDLYDGEPTRDRSRSGGSELGEIVDLQPEMANCPRGQLLRRQQNRA
jgi:hypothetical protein